MEWINLIGVVVVIVGFALKLDSILTIMCAMVLSALVGGLGVEGLLTTLGDSFVGNRSMAIFVMVMLLTGTLERNGLKEATANLIGRFKGASSGVIISAYTILRGMLGSFNVSLGGVAGFVKPIVMPMAVASVEQSKGEVNEEHLEQLKGMSSAAENIAWFFTQVLFVGGGGAVMVQSTLAGLGYEVELIDLAKVEIPIALCALGLTVAVTMSKDKILTKKYYSDATTKKEG